MLTYLLLLAAATASIESPIIDIACQDQEIKELATTLACQINETSPIDDNEDSKEITPQAHLISITNGIEPKMLEYKHWTGKYSPESFTLSVNGIEIAQGKTCEIAMDNSIVEVTYSYSFMNGMRTGNKRISYQLNENITQAHITFDWKDDWRVIINNGKAIKEVVS